jgi:hypothetical protein
MAWLHGGLVTHSRSLRGQDLNAMRQCPLMSEGTVISTAYRGVLPHPPTRVPDRDP